VLPVTKDRASLLIATLTGIWFYRFLLPIGPLSADLDDREQERLAAVLQTITDGDVP